MPLISSSYSAPWWLPGGHLQTIARPIHARCVLAKSLETPTVALHNVIEEVVVGEGTQQQIVSVLATNVYVKTPAGWKMVLHHASAAPEGAAHTGQESRESSSMLH